MSCVFFWCSIHVNEAPNRLAQILKRLKTIAIYRWTSLPIMTLWVAQLKQIYQLFVFKSVHNEYLAIMAWICYQTTYILYKYNTIQLFKTHEVRIPLKKNTKEYVFKVITSLDKQMTQQSRNHPNFQKNSQNVLVK